MKTYLRYLGCENKNNHLKKIITIFIPICDIRRNFTLMEFIFHSYQFVFIFYCKIVTLTYFSKSFEKIYTFVEKHIVL